MNSKQVVAQIDTLLDEFDRARRASSHDDLSGGLPKNELMAIRTRLNAGIRRLAPSGSSYIEDLKTVTGHDGSMIVGYAGILEAMKMDYQAGYLQRVEELVHAQVFDDFLEMANELLTKGYKDPAAVVSGSVLEEHIRKLANNAGVALLDTNAKPRKFDQLIIDLVKTGAFSEPQRKILTGWYAQRNEAAHGNYQNVVADEVRRMIEGIRDFMVRVPS